MTHNERSILYYFIETLCGAPTEFHSLCKFADSLSEKRSPSEYFIEARNYIVKFIESSNLVGEKAPSNGIILNEIHQMLMKASIPESTPEADAWEMMRRITQ